MISKRTVTGGYKRILASLGIALLAAGTASANPQPRVFSQIDVRGNERFRDQDVIVSSGLQTGVLLGQEDLVAAVEALEYTGEFEDIVITSEDDTLIITVDEAPTYTGGLTFGLGYDTNNGVFGVAGLSIDDAFGTAAQLRGNLFFADEVQTLRFQIRSEDFWSEGTRGGVRASYGNYEYDNTTFQFETAKVEPYVVFDAWDRGAFELRYTFARSDIKNVDAAASPIIQGESGALNNSGVGFSFATGSSFFDAERPPLDGWSLRFDQDFTGLGGDTELSFSRLSLAARKQLSANGFAIRTRIEMGAVVGLGSDAPRASERVSLGGARLRGFERGTIAPRDVCLGCGAGGADQTTLLGGNYYAVARTDVLIPIFPSRPEFETFAFFDIGSAWNVDTTTAPSGTLDDGKDWRRAFGIGASFDTQLGKFEAYYALDSDGNTFDEVQEFGLTFRTQF